MSQQILGEKVRSTLPTGSLALRLRLARVVGHYPRRGEVSLQLPADPRVTLDRVPIPMGLGPLSRGDRVLVGFVMGRQDRPVVLARLPHETLEEHPATQRPYVDLAAEADAIGRYVAEIAHETARADSPDLDMAYVKRGSWWMTEADGKFTFVHNQQYPAPEADGQDDGSVPNLFRQLYWTASLDADNVAELVWPFADDADRAQRLSAEVDAEGQLTLTVQEGEAAEDGVQQWQAKENGHRITLKLGSVVEITAAKGENAGLTWRFDLASGELTVEAPAVTLTADQVTVDSEDIRLGKGSRPVAYEGAHVTPHTHKVHIPEVGDRTTSEAKLVITEGAEEVKV